MLPHWVTACIPTYRCTEYLRPAVLSLLHQTYPYIRILVINDGDPTPPWQVLADISDRRLVRFSLNENRGPYFAFNIALNATEDPFFLVQDADDLSVPHRLERLLGVINRDKSTYVFSTLGQFRDTPTGTVVAPPLFRDGADMQSMSEFRNRIPHHGLFDVDAVRRLGGFYAGFRFGYDMLMTSFLLLTGRVSWIPEILYWRRLRDDSLSHSPQTGWRSERRRLARAEMRSIYDTVFPVYQSCIGHRTSVDYVLKFIRWQIERRRNWLADDRTRVYVARLRRAIELQRCAW